MAEETRKPKSLAVGLGVIVLLLLGGGGWWLYALVLQPFPIHIEFEEAGKLKPGDFLYLKGLPIGEVRAVQLQPSGEVRVAVDLYRDYRETLRQESAFLIVNDKLLTGKKGIEATVLDPDSPPVEKGTTFEGCNSYTEYLLQLALAQVDRDEIRAYLRDLAERAGEKWSEVDWERAGERLKEKFGNAADQLKEKIEEWTR